MGDRTVSHCEVCGALDWLWGGCDCPVSDKPAEVERDSVPTPTGNVNMAPTLNALVELLVSAPEESLQDETSGLVTTLHKLQDMGTSKTDLVVHLECERAKNEVTVNDPEVEQRCLDALDLVEGLCLNGLRWPEDEAKERSLERKNRDRLEDFKRLTNKCFKVKWVACSFGDCKSVATYRAHGGRCGEHACDQDAFVGSLQHDHHYHTRTMRRCPDPDGRCGSGEEHGFANDYCSECDEGLPCVPEE